MGQYFIAINQTKKEYVCPWCVGGLAKLWEWAANAQGSIFTLLLRQSSCGGGGDYGTKTQVIEAENLTSESLLDVLRKGALQEGASVEFPPDSMVGRWAGDQVSLVGDYDASGLYETAQKEFTNISSPLVRAWNPFVEVADLRLEDNFPCSTCSERYATPTKKDFEH